MTSTARAVSPDSGTHWAEPGAWRVAEGVHRIPLPLPNDGLRAVNVYAVDTDSGLTLIDGGWAIPEARTLLERSLREAGYGWGEIRRCLVTHVHRDHYTLAVVIRREVGARIALGLGDRPSLEHAMGGMRDPSTSSTVQALRSTGADRLADAWTAALVAGDHDAGSWELPDLWWEEDRSVDLGSRTLEVVHTPGHTRGHVVYADDATGLLFSGDHVLPTITPSVGFEALLAPHPLSDFMASLTKVRSRPDALLLPAHGPVAPSAHARCEELLDHHEVRLDQCLAALPADASPRTALDAAGLLPWTRHEHALSDLDDFNAVLAVLETRAHLEVLVARDCAVRADDGVVTYRRKVSV